MSPAQCPRPLWSQRYGRSAGEGGVREAVPQAASPAHSMSAYAGDPL